MRRNGVMRASWATSDVRGGVASGGGRWAGRGCDGSTQRFENGGGGTVCYKRKNGVINAGPIGSNEKMPAQGAVINAAPIRSNEKMPARI